MIRNLQSHEMELNRDESVIKSKTLALKSVAEKSGGKAVRSSKVWKLEEAFDDEEMTFIINRFKQLIKRNKTFSGKISGFRGSSSKDKAYDQKNCFDYKKLGHFKVDCPDLQKDKPKKRSFQKENFISKFKKNLMATWDEFDNEESSDKYEGEANLELMTLISSDTEYESISDSESEK